MEFTAFDIAQMTDLSAVRADTSEAEVVAMAALAQETQCYCATTLPCHTPLLKFLLDDALQKGKPRVRISGNVSFPSGSATSTVKAAEAQELLRMGCDELDMVLNIGLLRSGRSQLVLDDIKAVVETAGAAIVKVILECHYLTDDEVRSACELCIEAGAAFVKTGTGWAPTGATLHNIALIKACVGDSVGIKASGGIRDLDTLKAMYNCGARRFGIGLRTARPIFEQAVSQSATKDGM